MDSNTWQQHINMEIIHEMTHRKNRSFFTPVYHKCEPGLRKIMMESGLEIISSSEKSCSKILEQSNAHLWMLWSHFVHHFWRENLWKLNLVRPEVINGFSFFYILNRKQQSLGKKLQFWILSNHHQLALLGVSFHLFFLLLRSKYQFSTLSAIY